jgi:5'-deoxynucleotidase YfbR-like HD superfamily hydrolase
MQPMDPADKRPPFKKIANSIRAAILTGEFEPGQQLPPGRELAEFFGVAPMTVHQAIRILREEGFVTSRAGSGVYVSKQPAAPEAEYREHPLSGLGDFLHEMGQLKRLPRAGWQFAGIPNPESVAEHSFRAAIVGIARATLEGADVGRTAALVLLHDSPESRIGDVPAVGRAYVTTAAPEAVSVRQTAGMPDELAAVFQELVRAYEAEDSIEARLAHDADKLETLLQAREYEAQGNHDTVQWQESSTASLRTHAAKQLADAILATTPTTWWSAFARSYTELRKHTRGTRDTRTPGQRLGAT